MTIHKVDLPVGATAPFTLFHMSDNHICQADGRDNERKQSLARRRNGEFTGDPDSRRQEERTEAMLCHIRATGAPLIHTGDLLDFTSYANFAYARHCFDGVDVIMAAGNHEFSQYVGEAWEDETYKAQSAPAVLDTFSPEILFGVRVIHGVKFITLDNVYYYVTPELFAQFKSATTDGMSTVLCVHTPLFSEDLYAQIIARTGKERPPYLMGCPEERLVHLSEHRYTQQKPDAVTLDFLRYCERCPQLKAVLTGHLHAFYESHLDSGIPQYVAPAAYMDALVEYGVR